MLPMGTIMAACMFVGVIMAARLPILQNCPAFVSRLIGGLVLVAGLWNLLWYSLQHLAEFWGFAAMVSGILMILTAIYILDETKLPKFLQNARPLVLIVLAGYGLMYAVTIARL